MWGLITSSRGGQGGQSTEFRPLSQSEEKLLAAMLQPEFPGRSALIEQATHALARQIDGNGSLELTVTGGPPSEVVTRVPVEGELEDSDGVTIHVSLHVINGFMKELEIYREDSGPVRRQLAPEELRLLVM